MLQCMNPNIDSQNIIRHILLTKSEDLIFIKNEAQN